MKFIRHPFQKDMKKSMGNILTKELLSVISTDSATSTSDETFAI